ncbi:transcriptional regulator, LuxR family [Gordonia polyisoprenivorans VH2]|uniref:Transcriptional regulator, LuxR family n=1 Tax=Gordonia polyisoprenivorans (strain DSM 44266 / VH2) TaxID=1112204 RepID=H6N3K5_GORPV|nr:transcriptional regulator, LuxR family [Gordonia polyisoprenivorans VH2]
MVLMDLRLGPGLSGVETTRRLLTLRPVPRVLVVTNHDTDADILAAIEAGASGYLLKDTPPTELIAAVHAAAAGESALSPMVATRLMSRMRAPADAVLTAREIDVLVEVAAGHSNREIAKRLLLSEMTVKSHLVHIFSKLGVRSRTAAVDRARRDGLIG